jgi:mycofactocin biosynthesis protein MftB
MALPFDAARAWTLDDRVALRPEPFGALAYHFGTRRLSFLKSPALVGLVQSLGEYPSALDACSALRINQDRDKMLRALETLAGTGMIVRQGSTDETR